MRASRVRYSFKELGKKGQTSCRRITKFILSGRIEVPGTNKRLDTMGDGAKDDEDRRDLYMMW